MNERFRLPPSPRQVTPAATATERPTTTTFQQTPPPPPPRQREHCDELVVFGRNDSEQLGFSSRSNKCLPTTLKFPSNTMIGADEGIRCIKQGGNRLAFLTTEDNLFISLNDCKTQQQPSSSHKHTSLGGGGMMVNGQMHAPTTIESPSLDISELKNNISDVCLGFSHCLFLTKRNHELYAFGTNSNFRLGLSTEQMNDVHDCLITSTFKRLYNISCYPIHLRHLMEENERIVSIHALGQGTICRTDRNHLITFGWNYRGELCSGVRTDRQLPKKIVFFADKQLDGIYTGYSHVFFWVGRNTPEAKLYVCGWNENYQLGLPHNNNVFNIVENTLPITEQLLDMSMGYSFSFFLTKNGRVYGLGSIPQPNSILSDPFSVPNGTLKEIGLSGVTHICCGYYHVLIVVRNEQIFTCGSNDCYQCGYSEEDDGNYHGFNKALVVQHVQPVAQLAAGQHSSAILFSNSPLIREKMRVFKRKLCGLVGSEKLSDVDFLF